MTTWLKDALERVLSTYVQAFLGLLVAVPAADLDWSVAETAAIAALPAAAAVLKAILAAAFPGTVSPASLVKPPSQ
jgi:hypothetical protein